MSNPMTLVLLPRVQTVREDENVSKSKVSPRQLDKLIHVLRDYPISIIYSSDLWRAVQPAQTLAKSLGSPFPFSSALREIRSGFDIPVLAPGGHDREDIDAFEQRAAKVRDAIVGQNWHTHVVGAAHSGTIQQAVQHLFERPLASLDLHSVSQGRLVVLTRGTFGKWLSPK
jgi:broad specificity phosphatase PhoE